MVKKTNGLAAAKPAAARPNVVRNAPVKTVGVKTLGPVSDLERHLPSEWWRTLFNSLYLETDGDVVENDRNTQQEIDLLIRSAGLEVNDRILDLCCGQGRHVLELARRGFKQVTGIDRSRYLIRLARKRARQRNLTGVSFHEGDARKFRAGDNAFHCVTLLGNSFGYFDREEDDRAVLEAVKRALKSGGMLVMDLTDGQWMREHFEPRSWEWIDQNHFVCRERGLAGDGERLISREVVVHAERGVIADQFYAERLYSRERIQELLERIGFGNIRFHAFGVTESTRKQDLGMMAHRMFLTCDAPRKAKRARREAIFPEVTVLLGDPRLPDPVKRNGRYNPEDIETIERLKAALGELPDYRFRYLDNHASLIADLRSQRPSFVLNLCDEGYNNDAFMELHVPALLETLAIPYSGAGPSCLGLCYNKALVRAIAETIDLPVPAETYFSADDQAATIPSVFPAIIKPNYGDSSIGITQDAVVHTWEQAINYLTRLREQMPGVPILIQEFLNGPEYSVGIIGNPGLGLRVLPTLEVDYGKLRGDLPRLLSYESKWVPESPYWTEIGYREAQLDEDTRRRMVDYSTILFERLGCRDYARFDFRADANGEVKLLEVNPNPGWCWDGKLNLMASYAGLRYSDMLRLIVEAAQERVAAQQPGLLVPEPVRLVAGRA